MFHVLSRYASIFFTSLDISCWLYLVANMLSKIYPIAYGLALKTAHFKALVLWFSMRLRKESRLGRPKINN